MCVGEKIRALILTAGVSGLSLGGTLAPERALLRATTFPCPVSRSGQSLSLLSIQVPPWSDSQEQGWLPRSISEHRAPEDSSQLGLLLTFEPQCWPRSTRAPKEPFPWDVSLAGAGAGGEGMLCTPRAGGRVTLTFRKCLSLPQGQCGLTL